MNLEEKIAYHQKKYYDGKPEISDAEFDALWNKLQKEDPSNTLLQAIGEAEADGFPKAKHNMIMGSQDKFNNEEDFRNWLRVKKVQFPIIVQYKLDGLSIELQYARGILKKAVTRGDGEIGDDVTPNVIKMKGVPEQIFKGFTGSIRGEILLDNKTFEKHFSDAKNPRNMAAGITKRKSGIDSEHLSIIVYDVFSTTHDFDTEITKINFLADNGFDFVVWDKCYKPEEVIEFRDETIKLRSSINIAIDGIVLKQNKIVKSDAERKRPEYQRAFKFETEQVITRIIDVEWSRSGHNYTPVAILEPIHLMGSTVQRASLANLDNIEKLGISIGDDVLIHKAGEIIPQILKVMGSSSKSKTITNPETCEVCGESLTITGPRVFCPSLNCGGRKFHRLEKWIDKTGVKGFGPALLNYLFDEEFVEDIVDLYTLDLQEVLDRTNLKKATKKAFDNLYVIKEMKLETFVSGFDIEGIGEGVVKFAVEHGFDSLEKLRDAPIDSLICIDGFSDLRAQALKEAMLYLYDEMKEMTEYINIKVKEEKNMEKKLEGKSFCFTGKLNNMTRTEAQALVADNGGIVKAGVAKGLSILVTNDPTSGSSKNKKAQDLGVKLITEADFITMIK